MIEKRISQDVPGPATRPCPSAGHGKKCPTCGAPRKGLDTCHRCRSDLRLLIAVEVRASRLFQRGLEAYRDGWFRIAATRASAACRLEARPEFLRLLATSSLRAGDFRAALRAVRRLGHVRRRSATPLAE
ncbi:MAG: hypothetical protein O7J95_00670 [Planctomycetota bacterium]|nr:hypothetical protein [Planctomycetota bacterium]